MKKWLVSIFWLCLTTAFATPLPANEVFGLNVKSQDPNAFLLHWTIRPGYFLYKDRISFDLSTNPTGSQIGAVSFPAGEQKVDKLGHVYQVYRKNLSLTVPVLATQAGESLLNVHYQGCSDDGFCYPPEVKTVRLTFNTELALTQASFEEPSVTKNQEEEPVPTASPSAASSLENAFATAHWSMLLLTFYGLGLLLAFTPCVLPMVPVLSSIIVGHGHQITTRKAFLLSLSYVLSMACTYALVGAVAAMIGSNLQLVFQSPWAIGMFSILFVLLALSMFGFFELQLPLSWRSKLSGLSRGQEGGHFLGAAIMGTLSTLILSPCVTAPMVAVLGYIAQSNDVLLGTFCLLFLGLGMGTPLLLIGTSAGKWLPKAGNWMNGVKQFFGVLLLAIAIYLLSRLIPDYLTMCLWSALFVFTGIFLGALQSAITSCGKLKQGLGILLLTYGLLVLIGASMGNTSLIQPLAHAASSLQEKTVDNKRITSLAELDQILSQQTGKPVMIDFYADWCSSCKLMAQTTLKDSKVLQALNDFTVITADVTANNADSQALMKRFQVIAPPTFVFLDAKGNLIGNKTLVGEVNAKELVYHLQDMP